MVMMPEDHSNACTWFGVKFQYPSGHVDVNGCKCLTSKWIFVCWFPTYMKRQPKYLIDNARIVHCGAFIPSLLTKNFELVETSSVAAWCAPKNWPLLQYCIVPLPQNMPHDACYDEFYDRDDSQNDSPSSHISLPDAHNFHGKDTFLSICFLRICTLRLLCLQPSFLE
jgi:hypothetical protein